MKILIFKLINEMTKHRNNWAFKVWRKKSWEMANGYYPVTIVINYGRQQTYNLPMSAQPTQWNNDFERYDVTIPVSQQHPDAIQNNKWLDRITTELDDIIDDFIKRKVPFTGSMVLDKFLIPINKMTFKQYAEHYINQLREAKIWGTAKTFVEMLDYLMKFDPKLNTRWFPDITTEYIKKFVKKQLENNPPRKKGGISNNVRCIRRILNLAISDGIGSPETYPFSNRYGTANGRELFSISKELRSQSRKRYIPKKYLIDFYFYDIKANVKNERTCKALERTKAIFFLSYFSRGVTFGDLAKFKTYDIHKGFNRQGESIEYLTYNRGKTAKPIEIIINDDIRETIDFLRTFKTVDDYLLPIVTTPGLGFESEELDNHIVNKRKKFNKYIKRLAALMDFPESLLDLTSYFARHSFAQTIFDRTNHDIFLVSQAMDHSKVETTRIYLEGFGRDDIAEVNEDLLSIRNSKGNEPKENNYSEAS